jgi:N-acetylneuraminic acid mutarotase
MYIYGGHNTQPASEYFQSVKQDLYEYDLATRAWKEVTMANEGPRRTEHTAAVYNDSMVVFGGYSGTGYDNTVLLYDFNTMLWQQLATQGEAPSARSAHTAVVVGNSMYIFGGWNGTQCMNDLHELNFETKTWTLICADTSRASRASGSANHAHSIHTQSGSGSRASPIGDAPSARCSHGAVAITHDTPDGPRSVMYVFGGYAIEAASDNPNKGYLDDLYEFQFDTRTWARVQTKGPTPSPRSRFRMVTFKDDVYLFAGWNSAKHFSSLHRYNTQTQHWVEVDTTFDSDGIGQFSMVECGGIMYVFSGFSPKTGCRTNLFAYPLAPGPYCQAR